MKAQYFYKVFGLTEDTETGEKDFGYITTGVKNNDGEYVDIKEDAYKESVPKVQIFLAEQLGVEVNEVIPITEKEYLTATEED